MKVPVRQVTGLDRRQADGIGGPPGSCSPIRTLLASRKGGPSFVDGGCFHTAGAILTRTARTSWTAWGIVTLLLIGGALVGGPLVGGRLAADESAAPREPVAVREVYVPADEPDAWPDGEWLARPTWEYRQMLSDLSGKDDVPPRASLGRVLYTATWGGSSFIDGQLAAEVQLRGAKPASISLGRPTCALRRLEWEDQPAVWGRSPAGETLLQVRSHRGTLRGDWSLAGREIFDRVEFEAALLPAVISTLQLRLPASKRLTADDPVSVEVVPDADPEWRTWILNLGQQSRFRVVVSEKPSDAESPDPFAERVSRYSLTQDGLVLQSGFQVEGTSAATDQLVFDISAGLEVTSVTLGNDLELPFHRINDDAGGGAAVVVPLEATSLAARAKLSVQGEMPLPSESRLPLPTISLRGFPLTASRLQVTVDRPLELLDYAATKCRLIASTLADQETDSLVFEDWSADSRVTVLWGVPQSDVVADVIAAVDAKHARPLSRTLLKLTTGSGSAYELTCHVPRHWQVTRVTSQPWHRLPQISSWRTSVETDGSTQLWMEFRDSLTQNVPLFVEIWATRTTDGWPSSLDMPVVLPRASGLRHVHLAIQSPPDVAFTLPADSSYRPLKFPVMREAWKDVIADWDEWLGDPLTEPSPSAEPLYIVAEAPPETDSLRAMPIEIPASATTQHPENVAPSSRTERGPENDRSQHPDQRRRTAAFSRSGSQERPVLPGPVLTDVALTDVVLADVSVFTQVPPAMEPACVQTATYRFDRPAIGTELPFDLPAPGELIAVRVDESEAHAAVTGRRAIVRIPSGGESVLIEVEYRVPFSQSLLRGAGSIPLPQSPLATASLRWSLRLPDSYRLGSATSGTSLGFRDIGWRQRLLGPLGLAASKPAFWPFGTGSPAVADSSSHPSANGGPSAAETTAAGTTAAGTTATGTTAAAGTSPELAETEPPNTRDRVETRSVPFTASELTLETWRQDKAQHLGWVLLVAAFLTTTFVPSVPFLSHRLIRTGWVVVTGVAAALVPEALAVPCGGLFFGSLAGTLLPLRFPLQRATGPGEPRSMGSTRMLVRAGAGAAGTAAPLLAIALFAVANAFAYQPTANPGVAATVAAEAGPGTKSAAEPKSVSDSDSAQEPAYDAMIPIRSGEPTLEETPVVYVSPALLARWKATRTPPRETPPYLLREASYSISADYLSRPRVTAVFDVVRPDPAAAQEITLPLSGIAFDDDTSCRVNGRAATIIPLRDDAGIVIDVASSAYEPLPEDDPGDPGPGNYEPDSLLRIELSFRPRSGGPQASRRIRFGIPSLLSSVVEMGKFPTGIEPTVLNVRGATRPGNDEGIIQAELGSVETIELDWNGDRQGAEGAAMVADLAISSVELHPRRLKVRTRLSFRTNPTADSRTWHTVEVQLPPRARLNDVRAPGLADSTVIRRDGLPTLLQLAFETLSADGIVVEIESTLPAEMSAQSVRIPRFAFLPDGTADGFSRHLMALTASPGFRIDSRATELLDEGFSPVTPAHFAQAWGASDSADPDLAFSLASPRSLDLAIAPLRPIVEASVQETLTVDRSRFVWEAVADIECKAAPIAVHRLSIDPRIRISSVRVDQDGADRLVRWSKTSPDEMTLLLTEDFVGRQSIRLSGDFPFAANEPADLPRFSIHDAQLRQHDLDVHCQVGWAIDVLTAAGTPLKSHADVASTQQPAPAADTDTATETDTDATHTFDLLSETPPAKVRVVETAAAFDFERIVSIHASENGALQMRTLIRFPQHAPLPAWVELVVPADWARFGPPATLPELAPGSPRAEGGTLFLLDTQPGQSPVRNVEFSVTFSPPAEPSWTISNISLPQGSLTRQRLVVSGDCPFHVVGDAQETSLEEDLLAVISLPDEDAATPRRSYSSAGGPWTLSRGRPDGAGSQVTSIDSAIWEMLPFGFAGITAADVALGRAAEIVVQLPPHLRLVQASWGGELLPLPPSGSRSLTVPATSASRPLQPRQLRLWWTSQSPSYPLRRTIPLPRVAHLPVVSETVVFLGTDRFLYDADGPWKSLTSWDGPLESGNGPLALATTTAAEPPISSALSAAGYPPKTTTVPTPLGTSHSILLEQRRDEPSVDVPAGDERSAVTPSAVTLWAVNRTLLRSVTIVALAALLALLFWRTGLRTVLRRHSVGRAARTWGGATVLAALFWSMGPSAVGFWLLIACGTGWALSARHSWSAETGFLVGANPAP